MPLSDQLRAILASLTGISAEGGLAALFCGLLLAELVLLRYVGKHGVRTWLTGLTLVGLVAAGGVAVLETYRGSLFLGLLYLDGQALLIKGVIAIAAITVALWETGSWRTGNPDDAATKRQLPTEWYALLTGLVLGLFLLTMAVNLLSIYLSLELVSISSYLLTGLVADRKASEGGLKYLLFGAVSSAVMLYGMSLLYGLTGTLDITSPAFGSALAQSGSIALVAGLLTLAGLLFKLSAVPFHIWTPDAYQAAPVPVAAFFSVGPKAAALLVIMRLVQVMPEGGTATGGLQTPLAVVALAGILLGNLSALRQTDAKRLLAYSTIAQAGFLLVGVVAFSEAGFEAAIFYLATYLFISLAAFFLIDALAPNGSMTIADFAGLGTSSPLLAVCLTVVALALTGLPPTVGFTAKLLSFSALFGSYQETGNPWLLWLFGLGLANAVISLFYYLRIPFLLFFRPRPNGAPANPARLTVAQWVALAITVPPVVLLFLKPDWLLRLIAGL